MTKKDVKKKKTEQTFALTGKEGATPAEYADLFDPKENMVGIEVRLPQIRIIHQAQMFLLPGDEKAENFSGDILDTNNVNAWWKVSFDESGGGSLPDCYSNDGIKPSPAGEAIQAEWCAKCEQNAFGSSGGRGKACKNMKRVHIRLEGTYLPYRLTLPPSNLRAISDYITGVSSKGFPYQAILTEFSLGEKQNKEGIKYSFLHCRIKRYLDVATAREVLEQRVELLSVMRDQAVGAEEYE